MFCRACAGTGNFGGLLKGWGGGFPLNGGAMAGLKLLSKDLLKVGVFITPTVGKLMGLLFIEGFTEDGAYEPNDLLPNVTTGLPYDKGRGLKLEG